MQAEFPEIQVSYYAKLMKHFLDRKVSVHQYREGIFNAALVRCTLTEEQCAIIGIAFHDADDYDGEIRLPHTIDESELRSRVTKSLKELLSLGVVMDD